MSRNWIAHEAGNCNNSLALAVVGDELPFAHIAVVDDGVIDLAVPGIANALAKLK